jgi:agmatinase
MLRNHSGPVRFLGLPQMDPQDADVIVLPLPFEASTSYGHGTSAGPSAVLSASQQVEFRDDECHFDLDSLRIHTADPIVPGPDESPANYLRRVQQSAAALRSTLTIGIGGEHSLTPPLVRAAFGTNDLTGLTVVQFDAHTDLRHEYDGTIHSHACAMRRLTDAGASLIAVGIRASCREEIEYAAQTDQVDIYRAQSLANGPAVMADLSNRLQQLAGPVYLTIDIDVLDPSLCPATGTPEPGGLGWWPILSLLKSLLHAAPLAKLIGCDVVETTPMIGTQVNEFTTARIIGKSLSYWFSSAPDR